jgi:hypothetical protein
MASSGPRIRLFCAAKDGLAEVEIQKELLFTATR